VEVYHNGEWGTIRDSTWDLNVAQVVCNELGYGKAIAARQYAFYGQGSTRVQLYGVYCIGTEWSIKNCSHRGWLSASFVDHYFDAGVQCSKGNVYPLYICIL